MFRRLFYAVILTAALMSAWLNGGLYLHEAHLGQARTPTGFLDLGYLLAMVVLAVVAARVLLRRGSARMPQNQADRTHTAEMVRTVSVRRIRITVRRAFSTNPILASLVILLLSLTPVCLPALSVGGLKQLSLANWILVLIAELPIAVGTIIGLFDGAPPAG